MDTGFHVQNQGLVGFGSFMPNNTELYWNSLKECGKLPNLDCKNAEFGNKAAGSGKKDKAQAKNSAASRSHCEAERRRRERINGHLATLREFLSCSDKVKMDKATLLAEVISHVKALKKQATEVTKGLLVPTDTDEVIVHPFTDASIEDGNLAFKASICCQYRQELILDIRKAISRLKLNITNAEISTLEGRMKIALVITGVEENIGHKNRDKFAKSIQESLCSLLEKISESDEFSPMIVMNKKRRISYGVEPSTSSSIL